MGKQTIDVGTVANDGTGDPLRTAGQKINANFDELYGVTGQTNMIPIAANGMTPRTTNGAASGTTETTTNKIMLPTLDFDKDTDEFAQFMIPMPESWNGGTIQYEVLWTATNTGDVVWALRGGCFADGDALDAALGTEQSVTDTISTAGDYHRSARSSAVTLAGTPAAGKLAVFEIFRDANNGSDTLAVDARLLGVRLYITTIDYEDS